MRLILFYFIISKINLECVNKQAMMIIYEKRDDVINISYIFRNLKKFLEIPCLYYK